MVNIETPTRYTYEELRAIRVAREQFPDAPQRSLAEHLYQNHIKGPGTVLIHRSKQSIYGAIRRYDEKERGAKNGE